MSTHDDERAALRAFHVAAGRHGRDGTARPAPAREAGREACGAKTDCGFACELHAGHNGDHRATDDGAGYRPVVTWENDTHPAPAPEAGRAVAGGVCECGHPESDHREFAKWGCVGCLSEFTAWKRADKCAGYAPARSAPAPDDAAALVEREHLATLETIASAASVCWPGVERTANAARWALAALAAARAREGALAAKCERLTHAACELRRVNDALDEANILTDEDDASRVRRLAARRDEAVAALAAAREREGALAAKCEGAERDAQRLDSGCIRVRITDDDALLFQGINLRACIDDAMERYARDGEGRGEG